MTNPRCLLPVTAGGCAPPVVVAADLAPGYGTDFGPNPDAGLTERQLDQLNAERMAAENLRATGKG